jgi:hypothetical protein
MSTTKYVLERRFQLQTCTIACLDGTHSRSLPFFDVARAALTFIAVSLSLPLDTSELGLMQSVRYLARDVIMEFPMPSIENRLGGISKYVLRDKAGNGLFMVYDPSKRKTW